MEASTVEMANFPVIDMEATGQNIIRLRKARGLTVRDIQAFFGFEEPQAIYKWQRGKSLPTVDNLYALGALLEVPMEEILVSAKPKLNIAKLGQQAEACCPSPFLPALLNTAEVRKGVNHFQHSSCRQNTKCTALHRRLVLRYVRVSIGT